MNFLKKALNNVQQELKVIQEKGKKTIQKIEDKIHEKVDGRLNFEKDLIQIVDKIYWMSFPTSDKIVGMAKYLNERFNKQYYIWNVSEHQYEVFPFNEQVADHIQPGYPSPGLQELFMICKSIISWIQSDPQNVAIIHCQSTRGRSALIISCLLCLNKQFPHPGEALTYFCKQTKVKDVKILFPSQQLYLNYFANIINGIKLNKKALLLQKVIFSSVPKVVRKNEGKEETSFKPYLQIFKESKIIYNSLSKGKVTPYTESDQSIIFDLEGVMVTEDILFRCKHYHTNQLRYPVFRLMLHTGFAHDNVIRLLRNEIDFTSNVTVDDDFFIDLIFEEIPEKNNISNKTGLEYVVEECQRKLGETVQSQDEGQNAHDKEIQNILKENIQENYEQVIPGNFQIGNLDSGSAEKREKSLSVEEEERKNDIHQNEDEDTKREKERLSKLILDAAGEDHDHSLDEQEIDDYLDNLGKSDEES